MSASRNLTEAQRWLRQALHDRDAAHLNRDHGFHEHACFVAQQSAEKALKAFLYERGQGPVLGHSTVTLATECAALESTFTALGEACRRLDQLYIPTRYPNGLPDNVPHDFYDRSLADRALADLDDVVACVQRLVAV
ncbi:MAG: HEPN domain-containing protein [Candidatus Binatia bacterium]